MNFFVILLFLLASGLFAVLHQIPFDDIGKDFYRFVTLHYMVGMTIVLVTLQPESYYVWIQFSLVLLAILTGFIHYFLLLGSWDWLRLGTYWTSVVLILCTIFSLSFQSPFPSKIKPFIPQYLTLFHLIASAAILGAILDGMMCGHWYLVNPNLSLSPIRSISRAFTLVLILKILLVAWSLILAKYHDPYLFKKVVFYFPILFWVRLLVGLSGGLFFNWMSWKAIEHGNTQASTGILYACIVWIILGEFSGLYLTMQMGVPL